MLYSILTYSSHHLYNYIFITKIEGLAENIYISDGSCHTLNSNNTLKSSKYVLFCHVQCAVSM